LLSGIIKKSLHKIQDIFSFTGFPMGTSFEAVKEQWITPKIKGIPIKYLKLQNNLNIIIILQTKLRLIVGSKNNPLVVSVIHSG
jgi:hypothetical protein